MLKDLLKTNFIGTSGLYPPVLPYISDNYTKLMSFLFFHVKIPRFPKIFPCPILDQVADFRVAVTYTKKGIGIKPGNKEI